MADNSLQELLERVRAHLGAGPVDGDARQQLHSLVQEIEHKLGTAAPAGRAAGGSSDKPANSMDWVAPATPRLESLAVKFEVSHPALAETLREVIDTLGKAGL